MAQKFPGFYFSAYRTIAFGATAVVSMQDMQYLVEDVYAKMIASSWISQTDYDNFKQIIYNGTTYDVPKSSLLIKFNKELD